MAGILNTICQLLGGGRPVLPTTTPARAAVPQPTVHVFDSRGLAQTLGPALAAGGEGTVYPLASRPEVVVKVYHPQVLQRRGPALRDKIEHMRNAFPALRDDPRFAWPRISIHGAAGGWVGYGMRRVTGKPLHVLCSPLALRENLPDWTRRDLARTALRLVEALEALHRQGALAGDLNPGNFVVDPQTGGVACLDCDSYQVRAAGRLFPCEVGVPTLMPPELLDADLARTERGEAQEWFSAAVMIFMVLNLGYHPYSRVNGGDPVENLRSGRCPLGKGTDYRFGKGPWFNVWSHLPFATKTAFIQAFRDGHTQPDRRPSLAAWRQTLTNYIRELDLGWHCADLMPAAPKSACRQGPAGETAAGRAPANKSCGPGRKTPALVASHRMTA